MTCINEYSQISNVEKKHFDEIDIVKGIAILFVMWHHSFIQHPIYMLDIPWVKYAVAIHSTFYLNVFFLVSGYLYANSRQRSFGENFKKKVGRLLIPYTSIAIVNLVVKLMFPSLVNVKVGGMGEYLWHFFFEGGELWFVYTLFFIFLVWPPFIQRLGKRMIVVLILLLVFASIIVPYGEFLLYSRFIIFSSFFLGGYLLKNIDRSLLSNNRNFCISALLFTIFCVIFVQTEFVPYFWNYVLAVIGCWFVWTLSFKLMRVKTVNKALSFCGKYSLAYYWLNSFAYVVARTLIVTMLHIENTPVIAISIFLFCVITQTIAILIIRKIPYIRTMIGI